MSALFEDRNVVDALVDDFTIPRMSRVCALGYSGASAVDVSHLRRNYFSGNVDCLFYAQKLNHGIFFLDSHYQWNSRMNRYLLYRTRGWWHAHQGCRRCQSRLLPGGFATCRPFSIRPGKSQPAPTRPFYDKAMQSSSILPMDQSSIHEIDEHQWLPVCSQPCSFSAEIFHEIMMNLIRNPNINSSFVFRADVSYEAVPAQIPYTEAPIAPRTALFKDFNLTKLMVRTMIPRNPVVDKPLDQTCLLYETKTGNGDTQSLVVYLPHIESPNECPFYHPAVRGIAYLHHYNANTQEGTVSVHYSLFESGPMNDKLERTAQRLLAVIIKHGKGSLNGYTKRVHHDVLLPQVAVQNTYAELKRKYASSLIKAWVEVTDPAKHVFEDLCIAAFLIELWCDMYKESPFPGFVDIGAGNGLLVYILLQEGYSGWGFDARRRKSWTAYGPETEKHLREMVLIPDIIQDSESNSHVGSSAVHNGLFPEGTFIISNHADELTPWTPLLATISKCPYISIPCCSHALTGSKFRAPPPRDAGASSSKYCSLVAWVSDIAKDCGWQAEKEVLRIPSTRNVALVGRYRLKDYNDVDIPAIIHKYGGAHGWEANAMKLVKSAARSH